MKRRGRVLFIVGFILLISLDGFILFRAKHFLVDNQRSLSMIMRINAIQSKLSALEDEIWHIVYQPGTSREVLDGRSKGYQKILLDIRADLAAARLYSFEDEPREKMQLVQRSVESLARKADRLRAQLVLQRLDIESTKVFFEGTGTTSMLSDSHVAEMEQIKKRINDTVDVVNDNIAEYARSEVIVLAQRNSRVVARYQRWVQATLLINVSFLLASAWFFRNRRSGA